MSKKVKTNVFLIDNKQIQDSFYYYLQDFAQPKNFSDKTVFFLIMLICFISILVKMKEVNNINNAIDFKEQNINLKGRAKQNLKNIDYSLINKSNDLHEKKVELNQKIKNPKNDMYNYIDSIYQSKPSNKMIKSSGSAEPMSQDKLFDYIFNKS